MEDTEAYYVVKKRALPEVLLKVVEVNRLLETQKVSSVQEAVEAGCRSRKFLCVYLIP